MRTPVAVALAALLTLGSAVAQAPQAAPPSAQATPPKPGMALSSTSIEDGGVIPDKYTQKSATPVSPELEWKNVPEGTASFVMIMHDPDNAPQHKYLDTLHWMVFNIPATATKLEEGIPAGTVTLPDGTIQVKNARGVPGFLGPGAGAQGPYHHYIFEVLALDTKLTLGADATRADVMQAADGHILAKGILAARFHR